MTSTRLCLMAASLVVLGSLASAQSSAVTARIASVAGPVMLSASDGAPAFALSRGDTLNRGNRVDTRGGGRAVIDLSDGSVVIVQPETILVIKDFSAAASLRELFEIAVGAVRVKINHFSGKPNPYRMNSPTASIAVRGTEFDILVGAAGETTVNVYDGAVEVVSLSEPGSRRLIEAGRGVLVRPGQAFEVYGLQPIARDVTPVKPSPVHQAAVPSSPPQRDNGFPGNTFATKLRDEVKSPPTMSPTAEPQRTVTTVSAYDRYLASLSDVGHLPFLYRFNALSDTYLDSLENPAYASSVKAAEAYLFVVPTRFRVAESANSSEYGISPQAAFFQPVLRNRLVVGGSFGTWHAVRDGAAGALASSSDTNIFSAASVFAAVAFGPRAKHSVGVKLERIAGSGETSVESSSTDTGRSVFLEQIASQSRIVHNRITLGYSGPISDRHTIGVFVRYGRIEASKGDLSHLMNGRLASLDATDSEGRSREAGIRLRGSLSRHLSYGFVGTFSTVTLNDGLERATVVDSRQQGRVRRAAFGFGVSRLIGEGTMLSLDASGGASGISASRREDGTGSLLQTGSLQARFVSVNAAIHHNLTRKLFVSGSILGIWRSDSLTSWTYSDRFGPQVLLTDSFLRASPYTQANRYSEFGGGWRLSSSLTAQYLYGTDYGLSSGGHAVILRYVFRHASNWR